MSASMMPTRAPICASEYARLTETVDLPTPPLQLYTAIMDDTFCSPSGICGMSGLGGAADKATSTDSTHGRASVTFSASAWKRSLTGHAGVVR